MTRKRISKLQIGSLALLGLAVAAGIWAYPELRRFGKIHSM